MSVVQLSKRVWQLNALNPGPFTLQGTNTYLVGTGLRRVLIDTGDGMQPLYISNIKELLHKKVENARICAILLTHHHPDHVGGLSNILKEKDILTEDFKIYTSNKSNEPNEYCDGQSKTGIFKKINDELDTVFLEKASVEYGLNNISTVALNYESALKLEQILSEPNFLITVEGASLYAVPTPGHSEDHVAFYLKEENTLFSGDCLLGKSSSIFNDLRKMINSLTTMLNINPKLIYPGHGPIIDSPKTEISHNINHRIKRETKIIDTIKNYQSKLALSLENKQNNSSDPIQTLSGNFDDPASSIYIDFDELFLQVYGSLNGETLIRGAKYNLTNHLNKLETENKVEFQIDSDGNKRCRLL
ncbi:hypothetical protein BB561_006399 [Smittium simulii]|uniref:Metallo-beta-lactamase domain-containing protein n=1 Tax=Smittium simulii TaxID=133385 RepID=A0A2T9Y4K8_9FUNG|nr:hypothetical protein BB561_006399 [Smittium simulii]